MRGGEGGCRAHYSFDPIIAGVSETSSNPLIMEISHPTDKKASSRKVSRKKPTQGHQAPPVVSPAATKATDPVADTVAGTVAGSENSVPEQHPNPSGEVRDSVPKRLKKDKMLSSQFNINECVVERLDGDINVAYFKNPGLPHRETYEPFLVSFRQVFGDRVEDEIGVVSVGYRCDASHRFIPNKKGSDPEKMRYGWSLFVNDTETDAGDWALAMCKTLNESQAYVGSYDISRTNGKPPRFQVLDEITQEPPRKLDEVMMDEGIAKFLLKKYNLKDFGVRRALKTDEAWNELLQPYFQDVKRGRSVIEDYLRAQTAAYFNPTN